MSSTRLLEFFLPFLVILEQPSHNGLQYSAKQSLKKRETISSTTSQVKPLIIASGNSKQCIHTTQYLTNHISTARQSFSNTNSLTNEVKNSSLKASASAIQPQTCFTRKKRAINTTKCRDVLNSEHVTSRAKASLLGQVRKRSFAIYQSFQLWCLLNFIWITQQQEKKRKRQNDAKENAHSRLTLRLISSD